MGLGNKFLVITPRAQATKLKMNKWDSIMLKRFCRAILSTKLKGNLWNGKKNLYI